MKERILGFQSDGGGGGGVYGLKELWEIWQVDAGNLFCKCIEDLRVIG